MAAIGRNPAFTCESNDGFVGGAADGTFAAGVSGIWDENGIKEAWGDNYAACKLPTYTVAGQQVQMSSYAGYKLVGVNSYSKNQAWAAKFADWMTNEQNQTLRFEMRGQGPSNTNASGSGAVAESKAIQALQQQAEYSSLQRVGGTYWDPAANFGTLMSQGNPSGKDVQTLLNEMVTEITGEESTGDLVTEEETPAEEASEEEASEEASEEEASEEAAEEEATEETAEEATQEEPTEEATSEETQEENVEESEDKQ
jgi:arabinogalactan oligomer/maltooligosaccharide transport system substrate-binding protein